MLSQMCLIQRTHELISRLLFRKISLSYITVFDELLHNCKVKAFRGGHVSISMRIIYLRRYGKGGICAEGYLNNLLWLVNTGT
jgi:hypothetical protein